MTAKANKKSLGNDEVQSKILPLRTSVIRKGIRRTLNTAAYETIVIEEFIEETIEWRDSKHRAEIENNWTTVLINQFKRSSDRVLEELGLQGVKAYFKSSTNNSVTRYKSGKEVAELDLESLDSVG